MLWFAPRKRRAQAKKKGPPSPLSPDDLIDLMASSPERIREARKLKASAKKCRDALIALRGKNVYDKPMRLINELKPFLPAESRRSDHQLVPDLHFGITDEDVSRYKKIYKTKMTSNMKSSREATAKAKAKAVKSLRDLFDAIEDCENNILSYVEASFKEQIVKVLSFHVRNQHSHTKFFGTEISGRKQGSGRSECHSRWLGES